MHDAAHGSLFRERWANEVAVEVLCAAPVWANVARYRAHHLGHHAHAGTDRDPDLDLAPIERISPRSLRRKILRDLTGLAGLRRVAGLLMIDFDLITYNVGAGVRRAPWRGLTHHARVGARRLALPVATNVALALVAGWAYLAWVVAYLTTFSLFMRIRSLAEHARMQRTEDPLRNTRTTRASLLARATVAPLHVNYHLEHHLLPTVPWHRLPALGRRLRDVVPPSSREASYADVLRRVTAR
jgi:fatty acid desaturase